MDINLLSSCMYAIVVSTETRAKLPNSVADLIAKYERKWPGRVMLIEYTGDVTCSLVDLQKLRPSYSCFVTFHSECSRMFVARVHHLTREIDQSNPYYDTVWGILTGRDEEDVLFTLRQKPLIIRRVLSGTPVNLNNFESGVWYNEGKKGEATRRKFDSNEVLKEQCPGDASEDIVRELSTPRDREGDKGVDMIVTSGHASEKDWNIGYSFESGKLVSKEGKLCGLTIEGRVIPVTHNGSAKVYSAAGNCLMGHIKDVNSMALCWMHSAGVVQMTGYTVVTWFGYAGWGVHSYFIDNPGSMTFSEAFYANQQSLIAKLHLKYPTVPIPYLSTADSQTGDDNYECNGLLHDQDKVAFYGDPAYEARLMENQENNCYIKSMKLMPDSNTDTSEWIVCKLSVYTKCHGKFNCMEPSAELMTFPRPPVFILPCMMSAVKIIEGDAVANCRSVLLPLTGKYFQGQTHDVIIAFKI
ncbi:hypothetical protein LOD99_518 [Oopsacas minuta]|uniref:Uncharacterized protein n=1 Tax=Oopsacas minuta TaxID=111878 RepID=A0AAV7KAQ1_9METZ|nr:hypothetical protein LOD99_518 [Oopsacas minuta]